MTCTGIECKNIGMTGLCVGASWTFTPVLDLGGPCVPVAARDAPEDYNLKLDAAWASMQEASSALRRRALEILDWQQHHVEANADAMRAADELLLPNLGKHAPQAFSPSFTRRPSLVDGTMVPTARPDAAMNPNIAIEEESGGCVIL